ncbi:MAG: hypothetical protein ACLVKL_04345 [Gemmiger formicilis]|uniref:hypothetical protein n=1 Tax=Gemmiger formicilis TaxID=745368 RepID=UPI003A4B4A80
MDYTPYYETMRRTSLLRGMTDAELDTLMACFAPRPERRTKQTPLQRRKYVSVS